MKLLGYAAFGLWLVALLVLGGCLIAGMWAS
jgi:hypothetical protein